MLKHSLISPDFILKPLPPPCHHLHVVVFHLQKKNLNRHAALIKRAFAYTLQKLFFRMHICSLLLTLSFILLLPVNESIIRSFLCRLQVRVPHCMSGQSGTGLPSSSVARQPGPAQQQQHAAPCEYTKHSDWDFSLLFSSQLSLIQLTRISLCVTVVQLSTNMYYSVV